MQLKRRYDKPEGWQPQYEGYEAFAAHVAQSGLSEADQAALLEQYKRSARMLNLPPVAGVRVLQTGTHAEQTFKRQRVEEALVQGWMSLGRGQLIIHADQGDFVYTIQHVPGTYCCHCDAKLDDDVSGASARTHVEREHAGVASPDPNNPSGARVTNSYECVLDEAMHQQWSYQAVEQRRKQGDLTGSPEARRNGASPTAPPQPPPA